MDFQPVQWLNNRELWDNPQFTPAQPHNLPSRPDPIVARSTVLDPSAQGIDIRDAYRFASFNALTLNVDTVSIKFLDAPIGKRNFLGFRNASTAAQVLYIDFNAQATTNSWLALPAGALVVFDTVVSQDDLYVVSSAAGGVLAYVYSTYPG